MKRYKHPALEEISLATVMQALADPCRMAIIRQLLHHEGPSPACNALPLDVSKATRSHHFRILREAGLITMQAEGNRCLPAIRKEELNTRFPGLIDLIEQEPFPTLNQPS